MSHHIYKTEGIILGQFPVRESSMYLRMFTKDLGVIGVHVQGARELKSKLKANLGIYTYGYFDLVRGKEVWRLISADKINRFDFIFAHDIKRLIFAKMMALIHKMSPEELHTESFFDSAMRALDFFTNEDLTIEEMKGLELIFVMRVLSELGYWGQDERFRQFFGEEWVDKEILSKFLLYRKDATELINKSIQASHL